MNSVRNDGPLSGSLNICAPSSYADHVLPELIRMDVKDHDISMNSYYLCSKDRWINPVMKEFIKVVTLVADE